MISVSDDLARQLLAGHDKTLDELQDISDELYRSFPFYYDMWENWMTWQKRGEQREK